MRFPFLIGLLIGSLLTFAGHAALTASRGGIRGSTAPLPGGFVGSAACATCHPDLHGRWTESAHALSIREFSAEVVAKPFDGEIYTSRDIDHRLGPGPVMQCEGPGGEMAKFKVERVIGVRRVQMFTTTMENGRIQVLPVFLEVPNKRWFDYTDFIFGKPADFVIEPDSPDSWYTFARNFNFEFKPFAQRIVNNNDLVTRIPTRTMGYSHVGSFKYFTEDGDFVEEIGFWDLFLDRWRGRLQSVVKLGLDGIQDHSMSGYRDCIDRLLYVTPPEEAWPRLSTGIINGVENPMIRPRRRAA